MNYKERLREESLYPLSIDVAGECLQGHCSWEWLRPLLTELLVSARPLEALAYLALKFRILPCIMCTFSDQIFEGKIQMHVIHG